MGQKHTLCPSTPPPAALRCTNSRRATHKVTYRQPRHCCTPACSCLQQGRTPSEMDRCQQGDFWQYQTRFSLLLCYLLLCLHNCNFLCSFYTSQVESLFQKAFVMPLFTVFFIFSVTRFGKNALLESFGRFMRAHTWQTGFYLTNCCYPGCLTQSKDCAG